jgi:hypothetical protein
MPSTEIKGAPMKLTAGIAIWLAALLGAAGAGNPSTNPPPLRLALQLVDGSRVVGVAALEAIPIQTAFAKIELPLKNISKIALGADPKATEIALNNGDKMTGVLLLDQLKLETTYGKLAIDLKHIRELRVAGPGGSNLGALEQGLILHYSFDRSEEGKVADESGKGKPGQVQGARWVQDDKRGGVYAFNGVGDHIAVELGGPAPGNKELTVACWVKVVNPTD